MQTACDRAKGKTTTTPDSAATSNGLRLSLKQWAIVVVASGLMLFAFPAAWERIQRIDAVPHYRVPRALSDDYWAFRAWRRHAARRRDVMIIGDSVIWGEYAAPSGTLSAHLNAMYGNGGRFANLGLAGGHPLALRGLVRHYAAPRNGRIILHLNPLWMSTARAELRDTGDNGHADGRTVNHPRLIPRFDRALTAYGAPFESRLGVAARHRVPLFQLVTHWRVTAFDNHALPMWVMRHPYANPIARIGLTIPAPDDAPGSRPVQWREAGLRRQDYPWTPPADSPQWEAFQRTAETLLGRNNRLFVVVGPLNLHMLTDASRERYRQVEATWTRWLRERGIAYAAPGVLPSDVYCDASHPTSSGYRLLAAKLLDTLAFREWLTE